MALALAKYFAQVSPIAMGCMGFGGGWEDTSYDKSHVKHMQQALDACLEVGINFFDHADIYTRGKAEAVFGEVLKQRPELRQQMIIQSKCGIRFEDNQGPGRYDFSTGWITGSVEGSLKRLGIEQLDILLLHRPDPLMQIDELARAFEMLKSSGKVRLFGVSNMHAYQVDFLQKQLGLPLVVNQLEMSLANLDWLNESVTAGMNNGAQQHFSPGILEFAQNQGMQLQAWGCLAKGLYSGKDASTMPQHVQQTCELVAKLAAEYQVSKEAIVLAFLMRHPAGIQPVIGTTNPQRILACAQASSVQLTREHWYSLFVSARGERLP